MSRLLSDKYSKNQVKNTSNTLYTVHVRCDYYTVHTYVQPVAHAAY